MASALAVEQQHRMGYDRARPPVACILPLGHRKSPHLVAVLDALTAAPTRDKDSALLVADVQCRLLRWPRLANVLQPKLDLHG